MAKMALVILVILTVELIVVMLSFMMAVYIQSESFLHTLSQYLKESIVIYAICMIIFAKVISKALTKLNNVSFESDFCRHYLRGYYDQYTGTLSEQEESDFKKYSDNIIEEYNMRFAKWIEMSKK
jgi:hypothetical protein